MNLHWWCPVVRVCRRASAACAARPDALTVRLVHGCWPFVRVPHLWVLLPVSQRKLLLQDPHCRALPRIPAAGLRSQSASPTHLTSELHPLQVPACRASQPVLLQRPLLMDDLFLPLQASLPPLTLIHLRDAQKSGQSALSPMLRPRYFPRRFHPTSPALHESPQKGEEPCAIPKEERNAPALPPLKLVALLLLQT